MHPHRKNARPRRPKSRRLKSRRLGTEQLETRCLLATLSGFVFNDIDSTALFDNNDVGVAGVALQLTDAQNNLFTATTGPQGDYTFENIPKGEYSLSAGLASGLLDGDASVGDGRGDATGSTISNIKINKNQKFTQFNFAKLVPAVLNGTSYLDLDRDSNYDSGDTPLEGTSVKLVGLDDRGNSVTRSATTDGEGQYEFVGLRPGKYEITSATPDGWIDGRDTLGRFSDNSQSVPENGELFNDRFANIQIAAGQTGRNYNFGEFDSADGSNVLATSFDAKVVIKGSSADDDFEFIAGDVTHRVLLNGKVVQTIDAAVNTQILILGYGGTNTVNLVGGTGIDQAELRATSAKLTGVTYQVLVYSSTQTTVQSGGSADRALFYDTPGDEIFTAGPLSARLEGAGFQQIANDFHRTYAYTSGGTDLARLSGSSGDDRFISTPTDARLYGDGFYNYGRGFDEVHGEAGEGANDRAYLYDSPQNDAFISKANESRMVGAGFDNYSHGFDRVYAYSTGGADTAVFYDTAGSDYYKVDDNGARLYGEGYYNRAIGFATHVVFFTPDDGQADKVWFGDSVDDDFVAGYRNQFLASRDGAIHRVYNPDIVEAYGSLGRNVARIFPGLLYDLALEGDWDSNQPNSNRGNRPTPAAARA